MMLSVPDGEHGWPAAHGMPLDELGAPCSVMRTGGRETGLHGQAELSLRGSIGLQGKEKRPLGGIQRP
jgi:hypothetical protein